MLFSKLVIFLSRVDFYSIIDKSISYIFNRNHGMYMYIYIVGYKLNVQLMGTHCTILGIDTFLKMVLSLNFMVLHYNVINFLKV